MITDLLLNSDLEEIKKGYAYHKDEEAYVCLICGCRFQEGEIYPFENRLYEAKKAIAVHIAKTHGSAFDFLIEEDKKYTGLTDNQKDLVRCFYRGISDKDIAKENSTSPATVRYQRFSLREKAKQAKIYLALIELMEEQLLKQGNKGDKLVPVHSGAKMLDERHVFTEEDSSKAMDAYFLSHNPLVLKSFPAKEKNKIIVLRKIAEQFNAEEKYSEKAVNSKLKSIFSDFATLRRYLIEYGFMDRTRDCKEYWLKK